MPHHLSCDSLILPKVFLYLLKNGNESERKRGTEKESGARYKTCYAFTHDRYNA